MEEEKTQKLRLHVLLKEGQNNSFTKKDEAKDQRKVEISEISSDQEFTQPVAFTMHLCYFQPSFNLEWSIIPPVGGIYNAYMYVVSKASKP